MKMSSNDPDLGLWTFDYYPLGELKTQTDAKTQLTTFNYDALSRLTSRVEPDNTTSMAYGQTKALHNVGKLISANSANYAETYGYDAVGRLNNRHILIDGVLAYDSDFGYSATLGLHDSMTYPTSTSGVRLALQYVYNNGLLEQVKSDGTNPYAATQRAIVLYKAGRTDDSRKAFDGLRADAKTGVELNNLCWAKATEGLFLDSALEDCQAALKLIPGEGGFEDSLGMVLLKMGKLDEALAAYDLAVAKKTGAASLMGRAFVYLRKGDRAHAEADAAAARKMAPRIDDIFAGYGLSFDQPVPAKTQRTASK